MDRCTIFQENLNLVSLLTPYNVSNFCVCCGFGDFNQTSVSENNSTIQEILNNGDVFPVLSISTSFRVLASITHHPISVTGTGTEAGSTSGKFCYILAYMEQSDGTGTSGSGSTSSSVSVKHPLLLAQRCTENFNSETSWDEGIAFDFERANGMTQAYFHADVELPSSLSLISFDNQMLHKERLETVQSDKYFSNVYPSQKKTEYENSGVLLSDDAITLFNGKLNIGNGNFLMESTREGSISLDPMTNETPWIGVSDMLTDSNGYNFCFVLIDTTKDYVLTSESSALTPEQNVAVITNERHTYVILIHNNRSPVCYEVPVSDTPNKSNYKLTLKQKCTLSQDLATEQITEISSVRLLSGSKYNMKKGRGWKVLAFNDAVNGISYGVTVNGWNPGQQKLIHCYCRIQEFYEIESSFHAFVKNLSVLAVATRYDQPNIIHVVSSGSQDTDSPVNGEFFCVSHGKVYKTQCYYDSTTLKWTDRNGVEEQDYLVDVGFQDTVWYVDDKKSWKATNIVFDTLKPGKKTNNTATASPNEIYIPVVYGSVIRRNNVVGYAVSSVDDTANLSLITMKNAQMCYNEVMRIDASPMRGTAKLFCVFGYGQNGIEPEPIAVTDGFAVISELVDGGTSGTLTGLSFTCFLTVEDADFLPKFTHAFIETYGFVPVTGMCVPTSHATFYSTVTADTNDSTHYSMDITAVITDLDAQALQSSSGTGTGTSNTASFQGFVCVYLY